MLSYQYRDPHVKDKTSLNHLIFNTEISIPGETIETGPWCWATDRWKMSSNMCLDNSNSQIAKFMGPAWGPPGSCRPQMGPMLAPWTLLSGIVLPPFDSLQHLQWWSSRLWEEHNWNRNLVTLKAFSSLAALKVVIITTFCAASDEKVSYMMIFPCQWFHFILFDPQF